MSRGAPGPRRLPPDGGALGGGPPGGGACPPALDRDRPLSFTVDGQPHTGLAGDTLASALLANGVRRVADSHRHGRPRGLVAAGVEEPNALVQVLAPRPEPMVLATTLELVEGLAVATLAGRGRLPADPAPSRLDTVHAHADTVVVGAGPAGLAAASAAAAAGERVILLDDRPAPGGLRPREEDRALAAELAARPDVTVLARTTALGLFDAGYLVARQRRTDHLAQAPANVARRRVWRVRAGRVVVATGAIERPVAFAGNDLPGVMLAGAAMEYLQRYAVLVAARPLVFTTNDSAYEAVARLSAAGCEVAGVVDARAEVPQQQRELCRRHGVPLHPGSVVTAARGDGQVDRAVLTVPAAGSPETVEVGCDAVLVSGGWSPSLALAAHAGVPLRYDPALATFVPEPDHGVAAVEVVGAATGDGLAPVTPVWAVPGTDAETAYVDLARDATVADVDRALAAGLRSVEHVKRYTTIGTAHDQGRTSGLLTTGIVAERLGRPVARVGLTTPRPPAVPVTFAELAGRRGGDLADPVRVTALHRRHLGLGAVFEDVGQWKRPRYYPRSGEDLAAAVRRESLAAREGVALMDASTLGTIEVTGPDAGEFLDRVYTNRLSTLRVGRLRYAMMCGLDGMVLDDGTVCRLAPEHFRVTTTTGGAAAVLDWLELWLQTEWTDLRVHLTSTTDHWATIALVGPRAREVLGALTPGTDLTAAAFPFMTWQDAEVAGTPATLCRVSFSGELAFEVNVRWWEAESVWDALAEAGRPCGITPYGTETMHVLRAEKGFVIVGQDTDGTVTPQDLGYGWIVSTAKGDFVGRRSHTRADTARPDRKHLVGLLTEDGGTVLPEGAAVVAAAELPPPPVPVLGHVTSSYDSAALGRPIALGLVRSGRERAGELLYAVVGGRTVPARVVDPVFYDPEGERRDG